VKIDSVSATSARELRNAFGCFPTGVALATSRDPAGLPIAVTINSFSSVSLEPPLVSFALGKAARCLRTFLISPRFGIQILSSRQLPLSSRFAHPTEASWEGVDRQANDSGDVIVAGVAAMFLCDRVESREVGDHVVFVGAVTQFAYDPNREPLAFCRGRYAEVHPVGPKRPPYDPFELPEPQLAWG
jgi:flavin reductase (DIM6/NTAB) family NADH-FMN oxidoreductase RutF